jgi:hypothetical protein
MRPGQKPLGALADPRAQEEADRQDRHRSEELADACGEIEDDLEALKARFELYFLGIERREPARERDEIKRRVAKIKGEFVRNTALRFRIQTLNARFLSYERMWMRAAREKEEGVYRRDLLRARRHAQAEKEKARDEAKAKARQTFSGKKPPELEGVAAPGEKPGPRAVPGAGTPAPTAAPTAASPAPAPSARPKGPPAPGPAPAAPARAAAAGPPLPAGITEAQVRELLAAYVDAKRRCKEDTSRVTYEALARTVAKQVPELITRFGARTVEFKVVVKDGKALLKAVPKT